MEPTPEVWCNDEFLVAIPAGQTDIAELGQTPEEHAEASLAFPSVWLWSVLAGA